MNIQAVIFDRDNTIMHLDAAAAAAIAVCIAAVAPTLPTDAVATHWTTWPGQWPRTIDEEPAFWHRFWGDLAAQYQLPADAVAALLEIGAFYHTCFIAFPDTLACLAALRARGVRLAILTNFELPSIHLTLQNAGIDPSWFSVLLSSATTGFPKPDARAYLAATTALDLPPSACAFVDDLVTNVEAAQALGMRGWLLDRTGTAPPSAHPHIRDLHELTTLFNISWTFFVFGLQQARNLMMGSRLTMNGGSGSFPMDPFSMMTQPLDDTMKGLLKAGNDLQSSMVDLSFNVAMTFNPARMARTMTSLMQRTSSAAGSATGASPSQPAPGSGWGPIPPASF